MKGSKFTEQDLFNLQQKGYKLVDPVIDQKLKKAFGLPKKTRYSNKEKDHIEFVLIALQIPFAKEYKFMPDRRFRMDYAIIEQKIGIEYEGIMSEKSGHTNIKGYTSNAQKYNIATIDGWKILRYTALNYMEINSDLHKLLNN
jgi:hypothetical protein